MEVGELIGFISFIYSMHRLIHFEIQAADPARAMKFYGALFGWAFHQWNGKQYWFIRTEDEDKMAGLNGALMLREGPEPTKESGVKGFVCTIEVADVDAAAKKAETLGGKLLVPKEAVPTVGYVCYVKDTEGNIFGMFQMDPKAA